MPLTWFQIRNEYSLTDPELYRGAEKDDPEALLEGVAMAGLIGVLRQLGDLAEFAAEVFHDLHDEVMATAARGHGLVVRVQQLEAEFPSTEKPFLSQTSRSSFFHNTGVDWHPSMSMDQNLISQGDLPRFIMDSYEECRGPPRLFLLDKFDVAGAGSCLKRYTDPSFFKMDSASSGVMNAGVQRDEKTRKGKPKGSGWRNRETPEVLPTSHARLHQLFMEESVGDHINNPAFHVKLKRRLNGFPFESKATRSYMEKFLETPVPGDDVAHEISGNSLPLKLPSNVTGESGSDIVEISVVDPEKELQQRKRSPGLLPDFGETELKQSLGKLTEEVDSRISGLTKQNPISEADTNLPKLHDDIVVKEIVVDEERKIEGSPFGYESDNIISEVDNYMDAIATMDSEMETDTECRAKDYLHVLNKNRGLDSDETDEESSSFRKGISTPQYSESLSNLSENTPSDSDVPAKALSSPEICETEISNTSSSQCCGNGETHQSLEYSVFDGLGMKEAGIPNYRLQFEELSSSSFPTDLAPMALSIEESKSLKVGAMVGRGLDEISSGCNEIDIDAHGRKMYMVDNSLCVSNLSDVPSQNRDDFFAELSAENHPADEESRVLSHISLPLSCISKQASGKNKSESLSDVVLEAKHVEDECYKYSIANQIGSPISVASHAEEPSQAFLKLEAEIPNYRPEFGEPSSSSHSGYFLSFAEDRKKLMQGALVGLKLGESSPRCNELNTPRNHGNEDRMDMGDNLPCMPNLTHMPPESRNDLSPEHKLDEEQPDALQLFSGSLELSPAHKLDEEQRDTLQPFSGSLELPPEKKSRENFLDDVLEAEYAVDEHLNVSVDIQNDLPLSVASLTEEQPLSLGFPETEICDPDIEPNVIVSEAESHPFSTEMAMNSTSAVDGLQAAYLREQNFTETAENIPHLEPVSIEISPLYHRDKNLFGFSTAAHGDELCGFSFDIDMVGKDASVHESPSDFQYSLDSLRVPDIPVHLDDIATDKGHREALNVAATLTSTHCDDNEGGSKPPSTSPINFQEGSISILMDLHENGLRIDEKYSSDHFQDSGIEKEVDQEAIGSSDLDSVMSNAISYDGFPSEFLDNISDSVLSISRKRLNNNNGPSVSFLSDQNTQDDALSPLRKTAALWSRSKWQAKFQVDKSDVGSWHPEGTSKQFGQTERIQSSDHLNYEGSAGVSAGHVLDQTPVPEFVQQDVLVQGTDISNQVLPSRIMHPEALQIGLDEMPPLPPLPPVQWRVGKVQHASLAPESNLLRHNQDPLPQVLPHRVNEEDQSGHLAVEGEIIEPSNSNLALSTIKDENPQHADENLAGSSDHFLLSSLPVPIMVGHGNIEDGFPIPSETQSNNPFLLLPTIFSERTRWVPIASPVANAEHTISTYSPRSLPDALVQLEHALHTSSGKGSSVTSEGRVVCPPDISSPPPSMQDNQPQHVVGISGGQTTWPSSTLVPLSPFEDGKPNGSWKMKLSRPQNPLVDAVVAHDKSKLRKVTECARPQIGRKLDEKDSLLEQIRTKSFNLKPAAASRPSIQAPRTNLKVAAILEKANAIRQALAGSDEDEDGWSDS